MPRPTQLETVPIEKLVEELRRRFAAFEKAKAELFSDGLRRVVVSSASGRGSVSSGKRKRGGTSEYARQVSTLVQKIRHAKGRGESVSALQKRLDRLRAQHKG
jgi:hypothetical protein